MTYPLRLTADQYADVAEHYAEDAPTPDELAEMFTELDACPDAIVGPRRAAEPVDLGDDDRDAIPF
jgi:hypothetical protein